MKLSVFQYAILRWAVMMVAVSSYVGVLEMVSETTELIFLVLAVLATIFLVRFESYDSEE